MFVIFFLHLCVLCIGLSRSGYEYFPELHGWLKLHKVPANWSTARINCHLEGTFIASAWTTEFKSIINKLQSNKTQSLPALYSGSHMTFPEGVFTYLEEKSSISLDQSVVERMERCVVFFSNGTMGEVDCTRQLPYMCYAPGSSVSTPSCWQNNLGDPTLVTNNSKKAAPGSIHDTNKVNVKKLQEEFMKGIEEILVNGLKKESRENILQKYSIPKKATLFKAPKVNIELKTLLNQQVKDRDKMFEEGQQLLGTALAAVVMIAENNITNKKYEGSLNLITSLSDVAKLLSDIHYQYTCIRRKLISPNLDLKIAKAVEKVKRYEFLYDEFDKYVKPADSSKKLATKSPKTKKQNTKKKFMKMKTFLPFPGINKIKARKLEKKKQPKVPKLTYQRQELAQFTLMASPQRTQSTSRHRERKET